MPSQTRRHALTLLLTFSLAATPLAAESWTDLNGTRTVEADLIGVFGDQAVLKMADGRRVTVKLDQLRAESRLKARDLNERLISRRSDRVAELRKQSDVAAAPAPDPLPEPTPAPDYQPPADGLSAVEMMQHVDAQMRAGHVLALYDSLPETYRDQIDQLVAQASLKIDPAAWDDVAGTLHDLGDLIVSHQNWIFTHPRLQAIGDDALQPIRDVTLSAAGFLRDGFDPQTFPLEDLQTLAFRDWLGKWDQATAPYLAALLGATDDVPTTYEQTREQRGVVTVRMTKGEISTDVQMKKVDDRWVMADMADAWPDSFAAAQEKLDETPDGSLTLGPAVQFPAIVRGFLDPLRQASDASEFHAALDNLLGQATAGVEFAAGAMPDFMPNPRGGASGYPGGGGDMYEEDMYQEDTYDEEMYDEGMNDDYGPDGL